jgi:hypothetical protein
MPRIFMRVNDIKTRPRRSPRGPRKIQLVDPTRALHRQGNAVVKNARAGMISRLGKNMHFVPRCKLFNHCNRIPLCPTASYGKITAENGDA